MVQDLLAFIEQRYHETGLLPSKEILCEHFEIDNRRLAAYMRRNEFQNAFQARGLPSYKTTAANDRGLLTPLQLAVANMLLNTHDRNTLRKKLQMLNVTTTQFGAWQKQAAFQDYLRRESIARFNNTDIDARLSLTKLVQDADLNAIKYYMELAGIYSPNAQPILDLQRLLASVLELLVRYLQPAELLEVASGLESILNGQLQAVGPKAPEWIETSEIAETEDLDDNIFGDEYDQGSERDSNSRGQGLNFTLSGIRVP